MHGVILGSVFFVRSSVRQHLRPLQCQAYCSGLLRHDIAFGGILVEENKFSVFPQFTILPPPPPPKKKKKKRYVNRLCGSNETLHKLLLMSCNNSTIISVISRHCRRTCGNFTGPEMNDTQFLLLQQLQHVAALQQRQWWSIFLQRQWLEH